MLLLFDSCEIPFEVDDDADDETTAALLAGSDTNDGVVAVGVVDVDDVAVAVVVAPLFLVTVCSFSRFAASFNSRSFKYIIIKILLDKQNTSQSTYPFILFLQFHFVLFKRFASIWYFFCSVTTCTI